MNKTTKFINKLITDTERGIIKWFDTENTSHAFINNETVVLKYYRDCDNTPVIKMYIVNRYVLYPKYDEVIQLSMLINDKVLKNKVFKK